MTKLKNSAQQNLITLVTWYPQQIKPYYLIFKK